MVYITLKLTALY